MDYVKIGGRTYDVLVTEIIESFNILYSENTGRTISARAKMVLDPLGTFFGHKITFQRKQGKEAEYDRLFDYVSVPRYDGIPVEVVHGQTTIKYDAYVSSGSRQLQRISKDYSKTFWGELSVTFTPMEAQVLPE